MQTNLTSTSSMYTKTFRVHTKSSKPDNESVTGKMLIIEESLSIKHKNGGTNRQLYRMIVVRILPIWRIHLWWVTYPGTSSSDE
jgi:hypothetical protein